MNHFGYVLATKMLVDGKKKVRYMYREEPDNAEDSGWRFFCGEEDNAYIAAPENIGIYDISTVVGLDNGILPYLELPAGTALACGERGYFKRVDARPRDGVVARIDFLGSGGIAGESVEYTSYKQFRMDVERETYVGAPMVLSCSRMRTATPFRGISSQSWIRRPRESGSKNDIARRKQYADL